MYPDAFDYAAPTSVAEAVALLQQHPEAKVLAGGHSLLPAMRLRLMSPPMLVDIRKIAELKGISVDGGVRIGAYTTYHELETSAELRQRLPVLAECAEQVGDAQVRNCGTLGGSLAHADPGADMPAVALALGAEVKVVGPNGARSIPIDQFFVDMLQTAIEPDELLTEITIPAMPTRMGAAYEKFKHPASGYAVVGIAVMIHQDDTGNITDCRIGVTGAGPKAQRARAAEDALKAGQTLVPAAQLAAQGLDFMGDITASEDYRANLVRVLTRRALARALAQIG